MVTDSEEAEGVEQFTISFLRVDSGTIESKTDLIAVEEPIHIYLNEEHYATVLCTPANKKALIVGNLVSEGIVKGLEEIEDVEIGENGKCAVSLRRGIDVAKRLNYSLPFKRIILSSCGSVSDWPFSKLLDRAMLPVINASISVKAETVSRAVKQLNERATIFRRTGGVHSAALFDEGEDLVSFAEDVGRHNAVDKVIGLALQEQCTFERCILASTGRLSGDIVLKASRLGIPIVASLASALDSGIKIAEKTGVTLIGFVRGYRMNLYTFPERIVI